MDLSLSQVLRYSQERRIADECFEVEEMSRQPALSESQERRLNAYLGDFEEMRHTLLVLLERYIDDEERAPHLLSILSRIDEVSALADAMTSERTASASPDRSLSDSVFGGDRDGAGAPVSNGAQEPEQKIRCRDCREKHPRSATFTLLPCCHDICAWCMGSYVSTVARANKGLLCPFHDRPVNAVEVNENALRTVGEAVLAPIGSLLREAGVECPGLPHMPSINQYRSFQSFHLAGDLQPGGAAIAPTVRGGASSTTAQVECLICEEEVDTAESFSHACGAAYCLECWSGHINSRINSGDVASIPCPSPTCDSSALTDQEIQLLVTPKEFERLERFRFVANLREEKRCRYCPQPGCETPIIVAEDLGTLPRVECPTCHHSLCFECRLEWHEGFTCKEHEKRLLKAGEKNAVAEEEFQEYIKKEKTLPCPYCGIPVQKKAGCNHMTCQCGGDFCWICGTELGGPNDPSSSLNAWQHYDSGPCKGLQFTTHRFGLGRVAKTAAVIGVITVGVPIIALAAIPAAAIGIPVYCGYKLLKRRR